MSHTGLDFTENNQVAIFNRGLPVGDNYCVLTMEDDDFVRLTYHKFTLEQVVLKFILQNNLMINFILQGCTKQ